MLDKNARWVWPCGANSPDTYSSFRQKFTYNGGKIVIKICSVTNYLAFVNGKRVGYGQFAGYENEKYYDELDVTEFCQSGENTFTVTVWYEGVNSATHIAERGGVIFGVFEDGKPVALSCPESTKGGIDGGYISGRQKYITYQLGYTSGMVGGENEICYGDVEEVDLTYNLRPRPVKKLVEEEPIFGKELPISDKRIYDLGKETVGYLFLQVDCDEDCLVEVAYGEHLQDGYVRRIIEMRDFSLDFKCRKGSQTFEQFFVRVACRYLEVVAPRGVKIKNIGVLPVVYPQTQKQGFLKGLDKEIYDVCVRTLTLCMHEHYEDCPWREQALYVLDARNQMLCGYYAFEDAHFQRANIEFIAKGRRNDGLLELTYPAINTPAIPFFSLNYPVMILEYIEHTGDKSLLDLVMPTAMGIMEFFKSKIDDNGLIANLFTPYWNFYEWTEGSDGLNQNTENTVRYDLILNCAFLYASERFKKLCKIFGADFSVDERSIKTAIAKTFYDHNKGMFFLSSAGEKIYSQLGNAFAVLVGLGGERVETAVKGDGGVVPASLSMLGFVYDALLKIGDNKEFVLNDIRNKYKMMLDSGATSVWETVLGEADFNSAGSLCHGWSAMPVYYYNKLLR
ncbi:MAG: hypothetical protein IJY84_04660 [Clostridia bacterium]|nr:hypothetical protein [Clostridia bacterium]